MPEEKKKVDSTTTFKDTLAGKLKEIDTSTREVRKQRRANNAAERQVKSEARKKKRAERKKKGMSGGIRGLQGLKSL
jgi:hypothetical protein